jgi:hypothetical protein
MGGKSLNGIPFAQVHDAENRLAAVKKLSD